MKVFSAFTCHSAFYGSLPFLRLGTTSFFTHDVLFFLLTSACCLWLHGSTRTTLSLDDDVFEEVKAYAKSRDVAIGKAVSDLVRRGLHAPLRTRIVNGFHVVELPPGSPTVSNEDVKKLKDEL
jgi:hypothetical protein